MALHRLITIQIPVYNASHERERETGLHLRRSILLNHSPAAPNRVQGQSSDSPSLRITDPVTPG